jgi:hypothetical protein
MKNLQTILKSIAALAGVAMVAGCATDETHVKSVNLTATGKMTIIATQADFAGGSRTELDDDGSVDWLANDMLGVFIRACNADGDEYPTLNEPYLINELEAETGIATFTGGFIECEGEVASVDYYVYRPYHENCGTDASTATLELPATQYPTVVSFDGAADIMFGSASTTGTEIGFDEQGEEIKFSFERPFSIGKFTFTNIPGEVADPSAERVYSVKFTFDEGLNLVGQFTVDLTDPEAAFKRVNPVVMTNVITLDYSDRAIKLSDLTAYWVMAPALVSTMTVEIETTNHTITKTFSDKNLAFIPNAINSGQVNLAGANVADLDDVLSRITDL